MTGLFIKRAESDHERKQAIRDGLDWINWLSLIPENARVFIKPNLSTYPIYTPGVTTSPDLIDSLLEILTTRTKNITIGESDGGRHAWTADDAFRGHGLPEITAKHGAKLVNLSREPWETVTTTVNGKPIDVQFPSLLLHDIDVFITLPIPKFHAMTYVSLAFKNQWGCLPDTMRFRNHSNFDRMIVAIAKILPTKIVIFDGRYFLDNNGPLLGGIPIKKDLLIISDDFGAGSLACCEIMDVAWKKVRHFVVANREGLFPENLSQVKANDDIKKFKDHKFKLNLTLWNRVAWISFRSRFATWLVYDSPLDKPLHWFMYLFRRNPVTVFNQKKDALIANKVSFFETPEQK